MNAESILSDVSKKDFDLNKHVKHVLAEADYRKLITENMLSHENIPKTRKAIKKFIDTFNST